MRTGPRRVEDATRMWIGERQRRGGMPGNRRAKWALVPLISAVLAVASCAPNAPVSSTVGSGPAAPKPATTLRIGTRLETATGLAVFEQTSQREAEWLFHAGLAAEDAQGTLQ